MTPNQMDEKDPVQLEELNEQLSESLERCHTILDDYRSKFGSEIPEARNSGPADPGGTSA